jgi:anaerobic magnesium-protoporphyrin IX monomethyl ester cyclase
VIKVLFADAVDPASEVENRYRPLWPAYLAAYAEERLGAGQFDFRLMRGAIAGEIESFRPHIVAISSVSQNFNQAIEYARVARQSGCAVIVGGMHLSCIPGCLTEDMDIGCLGEGEHTFYQLLRSYLEDGRWAPQRISGIDGIVFRKDERVAMTPPCGPIASLDRLPHPKRSLTGYRKHDYMFTSRGCPYRCTFCASSRFWGDVRFASPEYVIEEIRELIENGVETISFYDDLFVAGGGRLEAIADLIVRSGLNRRVDFTCSCRADLVTSDMVNALKRMNVVSVGMGLESGCEKSLKYLKGSASVEKNRAAVNLLSSAGIQANASFIIGSPEETEDEILETYDFIRKSRIDFFDVYPLTPLPGTPVWDYAKKRGLVADRMDWGRLNVNFEVNAGSAVILSEKLDRKELIALYRKFRRLRFRRILKALPGSPWMKDLPGMLRSLLFEKMARWKRSIKRLALNAGHP